VKSSALDSVLVHFRVDPAKHSSIEANVSTAIADLVQQISDPHSALYDGNVTIRVDSIWGVDGNFGVPRRSSARFSRKHYDYDPRRLSNAPVMKTFVSAYDRCKANRRCNWGLVGKLTNVNYLFFVDCVSMCRARPIHERRAVLPTSVRQWHEV
jgi:hypothetical protein